MFSWHTRTWMADHALHQTATIGLGWYLLSFVAMVAVIVASLLEGR